MVIEGENRGENQWCNPRLNARPENQMGLLIGVSESEASKPTSSKVQGQSVMSQLTDKENFPLLHPCFLSASSVDGVHLLVLLRLALLHTVH